MTAPAAPAQPFTVQLARSGRQVTVRADQTVLDALTGIVPVAFTCRAGECGSCVSTVLDGVPEYRNTVLSARARQAGRRIALCVDRSVTPTLVLDL